MRYLAAVLFALLLVCGCSSKPYSFANPSHVGRHFLVIYEDLHHLHTDIDHVFFDIVEPKTDWRVDAN
jgi:hypothetical protein